jgi:hypothetical protein
MPFVAALSRWQRVHTCALGACAALPEVLHAVEVRCTEVHALEVFGGRMEVAFIVKFWAEVLPPCAGPLAFIQYFSTQPSLHFLTHYAITGISHDSS